MPVSHLLLFVLLPAALTASAVQEGSSNVLQDGVACGELNHFATVHASQGQISQAEELFSAALRGDAGQLGDTCVGVVLNNLAAVELLSGRLAEAEQFAARSIDILRKDRPADELFLWRPLQTLAISRFQQGKISKAREAFERMQSIPIERSQDRASVHGLAAVLLHAEGKRVEAETEYREALAALEQAGMGNTTDAAAILNSVGTLYIEERRFTEARQALDRGLAIDEFARDAVPMDRIKLLYMRAILHARQAHWKEAAEDSHQAVSLLDGTAGRCDPAVTKAVMENYATALRRIHQGKEARAIAARAAALRVQMTSNPVIDVAELRQQSQSNSYKEAK